MQLDCAKLIVLFKTRVLRKTEVRQPATTAEEVKMSTRKNVFYAMIIGVIGMFMFGCGLDDISIGQQKFALGSFTNDQLAGMALSYDQEDMSSGSYGECKAFVQAVVNQELSDSLGTGYCQAYLDLGSEVSGGLTNAVRGDVIQINDSSNYNDCSDSDENYHSGMHTAIFLKDNGDGTIRVVDSNYVASETVGVHDWDIDDYMDSYPSLNVHVYRLGSTTQSDYINNVYRTIDPVDDYTAKACQGITGGAGTNWVYSCTVEDYTYSQYETVYILGGIHNIRADHQFKVVFNRNSSYYSTSYSGFNYVSGVWEHAYTFPSLYLSQTGSYVAYIYVDTDDDSSDDWEYLDYVPFTVN